MRRGVTGGFSVQLSCSRQRDSIGHLLLHHTNFRVSFPGAGRVMDGDRPASVSESCRDIAAAGHNNLGRRSAFLPLTPAFAYKSALPYNPQEVLSLLALLVQKYKY